VQFVGAAYDPEDGMLPGTSLTWNSDREGLMGHGQHLKMRAMSRGAHVVTLTATDKKGNSASARVNVVIGRDRLPSSMLPNSPFPAGSSLGAAAALNHRLQIYSKLGFALSRGTFVRGSRSK